jgi:hypothetical protein
MRPPALLIASRVLSKLRVDRCEKIFKVNVRDLTDQDGKPGRRQQQAALNPQAMRDLSLVEWCESRRGGATLPVVPENPIRPDSRIEVESAHHPGRCLVSFSYLGL